MESRLVASPYQLGASVSSVELLLEARTAAEAAAPLASRVLGGSLRVDERLRVEAVTPGPASVDGAVRFAAEARSGMLGALHVLPETIVRVGDLVMGGRGVTEDRPPTALELELFAERLLEPVGIILDAVAPGRPEPVALIQRDVERPARSMVVELSLVVAEDPMAFHIEVLAHHLADDDEHSNTQMEEICSEVPLELRFRFNSIQLQAHEVAMLAPGDVICLEHDASDPLVGEVDGRPMLKGRIGMSKRRAAVQVVDLIERNA